MNRLIPLLLIFCMMLSGCGGNVPASEPPGPAPVEPSAPSVESPAGDSSSQKRILIAYFSVPEDVDTSNVDAVAGASIVVSEGEKLGNTQYVAELIHDTIGGDLFRIETVEPYPLDHDPLVDQANQEKADSFRPELAAHVDNFDQYDVILLGYPNWWGDLPMPLYSFLEEYDFGAKTIIPFITHGGSRASRTVETISALQSDALVLDNALVLSRNDVAGSAKDVIAWAEGLGMNDAGAVPEV